MGKYLEALKLLYDEDENNFETLDSGTDKTDRSPFVSNVSSTSWHIKSFQSSNDQDSVPFTDHELAEHTINRLKLHDDRVYLRQKLIGIYGKKRFDLAYQYLTEWKQGSDAESIMSSKENAGRKRANTWLLNRGEQR